VASLSKAFVVALLIGTIAVSLVAPAAVASPTSPRSAKAVSITLYGSQSNGWGFGPNNMTQPGPPIAVTTGDVITFTLFAADSQQHNLVIDLNSNQIEDTGEPHSNTFSSPTTSITFQYTANVTGTLLYICGIHGGALMRGTLTVSAPTAPPTDNTLLIVAGVVVVVVIVGAGAAMAMRRRKPKPPPNP